MDISIEGRLAEFVQQAVHGGRFGSVDDVVAEGLRLVQEQEARFAELRATIQAAIAEGGEGTAEDLDAELDAVEEALRREGY